MSATLGRKLVVWSACLADNESQRVRLRTADLRRQLEEARNAGHAAAGRTPEELTASLRELEAENTALETELRELDRLIAHRQRAVVDREIARRNAVFAELHRAAEAETQRTLLERLAGLERLLSGRADPAEVWGPDGGVPWRWDSLPALAEAQVRSSIHDGLLHDVCDRMLERMQELERCVGSLQERLKTLAACRAVESALAARLAMLEAMVGKDGERTFREPALLAYYASDEGLTPQQTHDLIETLLQPLCQDAVMESAVWHIQDRPELARITHPPTR